MNKFLRTILIISVAIFTVGLLVTPTQAQVNEIDVVFEETPLFKEVNFLPGQSVSRWVKVTNLTASTTQIGVNVINPFPCVDTYCLSDKLELVISEQGNPSPLHTGFLTYFFGKGEILLSDLAPNGVNTYDFSVTFNPGGDDDYYQGLTTGEFDFKIGCFGEEAIGPQLPPGGSGDYAGLNILHEHASGLGTEEVTIIWLTERDGVPAKATSRVIYARFDEPHSLDKNSPPNYGYANSTVEDPEKVVGHSVTITGLSPGVTYYYRCVSHTSPDETISRQHSFTTKGIASEEFYEEEEFEEPVGEGITEEGEVEELVIGAEAEEAEEKEEEEVREEGREEVKGLNKFLAAVGSFFNLENLCWILFFFIVILIISFLLLKEKKEETEEGKKKWWILPLVIVLLIILYCLFCPKCWILILIALILFILFLLLRMRKKKEEESKTQSLFGKGF